MNVGNVVYYYHMPIYVYRCPEGHETERIEGFSNPKPIACPYCDKQAMRQLGSFTPHFKGKGFHNTDYKKSTKKPSS